MYVGPKRTLDYTIRKFPHADDQPDALHTMEFVLRDYFRLQFPDLLIVGLPFVHDLKYRSAGNNEMALIRNDIETVFKTVVKYTPSSTQVTIITLQSIGLFPPYLDKKRKEIERAIYAADLLFMLGFNLSTMIDRAFVLTDRLWTVFMSSEIPFSTLLPIYTVLTVELLSVPFKHGYYRAIIRNRIWLI